MSQRCIVYTKESLMEERTIYDDVIIGKRPWWDDHSALYILVQI